MIEGTPAEKKELLEEQQEGKQELNENNLIEESKEEQQEGQKEEPKTKKEPPKTRKEDVERKDNAFKAIIKMIQKELNNSENSDIIKSAIIRLIYHFSNSCQEQKNTSNSFANNEEERAIIEEMENLLKKYPKLSIYLSNLTRRWIGISYSFFDIFDSRVNKLTEHATKIINKIKVMKKYPSLAAIISSLKYGALYQCGCIDSKENPMLPTVPDSVSVPIKPKGDFETRLCTLQSFKKDQKNETQVKFVRDIEIYLQQLYVDLKNCHMYIDRNNYTFYINEKQFERIWHKVSPYLGEDLLGYGDENNKIHTTAHIALIVIVRMKFAMEALGIKNDVDLGKSKEVNNNNYESNNDNDNNKDNCGYGSGCG